MPNLLIHDMRQQQVKKLYSIFHYKFCSCIRFFTDCTSPEYVELGTTYYSKLHPKKQLDLYNCYNMY